MNAQREIKEAQRLGKQLYCGPFETKEEAQTDLRDDIRLGILTKKTARSASFIQTPEGWDIYIIDRVKHKGFSPAYDKQGTILPMLPRHKGPK